MVNSFLDPRRMNLLAPPQSMDEIFAQEQNPNMQFPQADFSPNGSRTDDSSQQPQTPAQRMSMQDRLKMLYDANQAGPAMKRYSDFLGTAPQNDPSTMQRVFAAMSGAGAGWQNPANGPKVAQEALEGPFDRNLKNWQIKGKGLEEAANLEDKNNKEKIALFGMADKQDKEEATESRNATNDKVSNALKQKQTENYDSLIKERAKGGWSFHEDKTTGNLVGIDKNGTRRDFGKIDLTPQQKTDLDIKKFNQEEGTRQGNRKKLFDYQRPGKLQDAEKLHEKNRTFDVANPLPSRTGAGNGANSFVIPSQQLSAYKQAAKELNIENKGKYKNYINQDGTIKNPEDVGGFFSNANEEGLSDFFNLVKERAQQNLSKRKTQSSATGMPSTTPGGRTIFPPQ